METKFIFQTIFLLVLIQLWCKEIRVRAGDTFDITKYGAVADGKTDNSKVYKLFLINDL